MFSRVNWAEVDEEQDGEGEKERERDEAFAFFASEVGQMFNPTREKELAVECKREQGKRYTKISGPQKGLTSVIKGRLR